MSKQNSVRMSIVTNSLALGLSFLTGYIMAAFVKPKYTSSKILSTLLTLIVTILIALFSYYVIYWTTGYIPMSLAPTDRDGEKSQSI